MIRQETTIGLWRRKLVTIGVCTIMLLGGTAVTAHAKGGSGGSGGHGTGHGSHGGHAPPAGGAGPLGFATERGAPGTYCQPGVCQSPSQK